MRFRIKIERLELKYGLDGFMKKHKWLRLSYFDPRKNCAYYYLMPFHVIIKFLRDIKLELEQAVYEYYMSDFEWKYGKGFPAKEDGAVVNVWKLKNFTPKG